MSAYEKLRELLYSESFDLQVSPRRRLATTPSLTSVNGGNEFQVALVALDKLLIPGDAFFFEHASLNLTLPIGAASTVTMNALSLQVSSGASLVLLGLGECRGTTSIGQATTGLGSAAMFYSVDPALRLWTWQDFTALFGFQLTSANQPMTFKFQFNVTDNSAGGNALAGRALVFYRLVRGLQEN